MTLVVAAAQPVMFMTVISSVFCPHHLGVGPVPTRVLNDAGPVGSNNANASENISVVPEESVRTTTKIL